MKKSFVAILSSVAIFAISSSVFADMNSQKSRSTAEKKVYHKSERTERWCKSHPRAKKCRKQYSDSHAYHHHHYRHHHPHHRNDVKRENGSHEERAMRHLEDHR